MKRGYRMEYRVKVGDYFLTKFEDLRDMKTFFNSDEDGINAFTFSGNLSTLQDLVTKYNRKKGSDFYVVNEAGQRITPEHENDGLTYHWYVNGLWVSKVNDGTVETVPLIEDALVFDSFEEVEKAKMTAAEWGYSVKDSITLHEENKKSNTRVMIPSRKKESKGGDAKEKDERFYIGVGGLWISGLTTQKLEVETTMNKQKAFTFTTLEKAKQFVKDASDFGYYVDSWAIYSNTSEDRVYEFNLENNIPEFDLDGIEKAIKELRMHSNDLRDIQKEIIDLEKSDKKDGKHYVSFLMGGSYGVSYETAHKVGDEIANDLMKNAESAKRRLAELTSLRLK